MTDDTTVNKQNDKDMKDLLDYLKPKTMKTNWTIFFDKRVMKAYKMPELLPEHPDRHYMAGSYGTTMYKEQVQEEQEEIDNENDKRIEAARLSALPVAEESKFDVINDLAAQAAINERLTYEQFIAWQPDQTKEYQIEAEFEKCKCSIIEEQQCQNSNCHSEGKCTQVVLVLSSNH